MLCILNARTVGKTDAIIVHIHEVTLEEADLTLEERIIIGLVHAIRANHAIHGMDLDPEGTISPEGDPTHANRATPGATRRIIGRAAGDMTVVVAGVERVVMVEKCDLRGQYKADVGVVGGEGIMQANATHHQRYAQD